MTKTIFLAVITICLFFGAFYIGLNIGLTKGIKSTFHNFNVAMGKMGYTRRQRADFFKAMHAVVTAEDKDDAPNE